LVQIRQFAPVDHVGQRLDLDHIRSFAQELARQVAPLQSGGVLQTLGRAFSAMAPETDRTGFHKVLNRIKRRTRLSRNLNGRPDRPVTLIDVAMR
jgi:hypothetical protein